MGRSPPSSATSPENCFNRPLAVAVPSFPVPTRRLGILTLPNSCRSKGEALEPLVVQPCQDLPMTGFASGGFMQSTECIVSTPGDEKLEVRLLLAEKAHPVRASVLFEIAPGAAMPQLNFLEEGPPVSSACQLHRARLMNNFPQAPTCLVCLAHATTQHILFHMKSGQDGLKRSLTVGCCLGQT